MNQYKTYGVRLPLDASARIGDESRRTGIQQSVLLRSIILKWIATGREKPVAGGGLGGTTPAAGAQHAQHGGVAHESES